MSHSQIDQSIIQQLDGVRTLRTWNGLHMIPSWVQPGNTGNTGGGDPSKSHGKYAWAPATTLDGTAGMAIAPAAPWDNFYFYNSLSTDRLPYQYFGYQLAWALPTPNAVSACNDLEFELELCEDGLRYNMAWQWKPSLVDGPPAWRTFDKQAQKWVVEPRLPAPKAVAGQFVFVWAHFAVDRAAKVVTHDSIIVDGTTYQIGTTRPAVQGQNHTTQYLHNGWQQNPNGSGMPPNVAGKAYAVNLKAMAVRAL